MMPPRLEQWSRFLPIVAVVRGYRRDDLPHDLIAGLVLGVVTIPQAVAYAFLAGLPAEAGLYACLAPMTIYAVLGSSRQLVVGPVAIAALMVAATVGEHAVAYSDQYLGIAITLSLQVGLFLWLLRLLQLGGIVNLLSHPVISGFVNAAAVLIIISQLGAFVGLDAFARGDAMTRVAALLGNIAESDAIALAIGLASLAMIWVVRRLARVLLGGGKDHPVGRIGPMVVAVVAAVAVGVFGLEVGTVGFVPTGLPVLTMPLLDLGLWWDLAPNAALIALVAYLESYSVGRTLAARHRQRIDSHQELIALGAANIGAAFTGAYPVAGSFSRSSLNHAAGGRTPASVLICAVVIVLALLWLTPAFEHLPHAALAAIVMTSVWGLIDFRAVRRAWRFYRPDVAAHFATFAGVLVAGVEAGLLLGVAIAIVLFIRGSSRPHIAVLGRLGDSPHFRNVERFPVRTWRHLVAVRVDESLYFANADQIETRLVNLAAETPADAAGGAAAARHLVLVMSAVNFIDTSGLEMLERLAFRLGKVGVALHLCEVKGPVRDQLEQVDLTRWLSGRVFPTTDDAFNALTRTDGKWVWAQAPAEEQKTPSR